MEELLALQGQPPEFQLCDYAPYHFDLSGCYVHYTSEECAAFAEELREKTKRIFELGRLVSKAFVEIGYLLWEIRNDRLYLFASIKSQTFDGIEDFAFKVFGFQKSTTYNLIRIIEEFGDRMGGLSEDYRDYSYSQLVELAPLQPSQRIIIKPDATVSEIREMRKGMKKHPAYYVPNRGKSWREILMWFRERDAEEAVAEKKEKKEERTRGFLEMLSSAESSEPEISSPSPQTEAAEVPAETVTESVPAAVGKNRLELKNREERKKWVEGVFEGASPYWTISELDLKIYRYVFVNGAKLYRFNGVTYWEAWSTEPGREDTTSKYFITDSKCPKFDMCRARSVNQVVDWLTEHGKEI